MLRLAFLMSAFVSISAFANNDPAPANYTWVGCVPSVSECAYSCPSRSFYVPLADDRCDAQDYRTKVSCYCKVPPKVESPDPRF